ncbi:hypothetical protein EUX98_g2599 [Antrodiella citrinella]|uniref:Uncharacterized protein n=1 Tax=Antrodiella citrinella TaxID=2447956 RepID=A0A4S4N6Y7_9APHY|nr:hypothetical protein EUX98_g2599 [Antrodiella citrinella]
MVAPLNYRFLPTEADHPDQSPTISFWLEPRSDPVSQAQFAQLSHTLPDIAERAPHHVTTRLLFRENSESSLTQLHVMFLPFKPQLDATASADADIIPIKDYNGKIAVPSSAADIPFDVPVRVRFWLRYITMEGFPAGLTSTPPYQLVAALESLLKQVVCLPSADLDDTPEKRATAFEKQWLHEVNQRCDNWIKRRGIKKTQTAEIAQLNWVSHVVQYVDFTYDQVKIHASAKSVARTTPRVLNPAIPLYGPRFTPPEFYERFRREATPDIKPELAYLRPVTIVHPLYYPQIGRCPCGNKKPLWEGWTTTGHRDVHGIWQEETALGFRIRCKLCHGESQGKTNKEGYCIATTNPLYWEKWNLWEIPRGVPYFFKRCAVTAELFQMIDEMRPLSTAAGLEENIRQLHLLEYKAKMGEYLQMFEHRLVQSTFCAPTLLRFSAYNADNGYRGQSITHDLITDVYATFCDRSRVQESTNHLRTLSAKSLSLDATFKFANRATVVDKEGGRHKLVKGGVLSMINEHNLTVGWRACQDKKGAQITELMQGFKGRLTALEHPDPSDIVSDRCCTDARAIKEVFPNSHVCLDSFHFQARFGDGIMEGTRNVMYSIVLKEIVEAILEKHACGGEPAKYWKKEDQEVRLKAVYDKYLESGTVWSEGAIAIFDEQLSHVRKGCLTRTRDDICVDGSRIEGSHKGWGRMMKSFTVGLVTLLYLGHDFVLRRNIRVIHRNALLSHYPFIASTYGSHYIGQVDFVARHWNRLLRLLPKGKGSKFDQELSILEPADSDESFGLVQSESSTAFGGLLEVKSEEEEWKDMLTKSTRSTEHLFTLSKRLNIQPAKLFVPATAPLSSETIISPISALGVPDAVVPNSGSLSSNTPSTQRRAIMGPVASSSSGVSVSLGITSESIRNISAATATVSEEPPKEVKHNDNVDKDHRQQEAVIDLTCVGDSDAEDSSQARKIRANNQLGSGLAVGPPPSPRKRRLDVPPSSTSGEPSDQDDMVSPAKRLRVSTNSTTQPEVALTAASITSKSSAVRFGKQIDMFFDRPSKPTSKSKQALTGAAKLGLPEVSHSDLFLPDKTPTAPQAHCSDPVAPSPSAAAEEAPMDVFSPLPLPAHIARRAFTPTELLFSLATNIDTRSLKIGEDDEFYLFMELRKIYGWSSFGMTTTRWAQATIEYNNRLQVIRDDAARRNGLLTRPIVKKSPKALIEKILNVEKNVLVRLKTRNFVSKRSGTETFWKEHCYAVPLGKDMAAAITGPAVANATAESSTNKMTCTRCHTLMYPGPTGSTINHKRGYCSDGAPVRLKCGSPRIPYPQPAGIFTKAEHFHHLPFLMAVRELHRRVTDEHESATDMTMEYTSFSALLGARLVQIGDDFLFRLYTSMSIDEKAVGGLTVMHNGLRYLRVDCLRQGGPQAPADGAALSLA